MTACPPCHANFTAEPSQAERSCMKYCMNLFIWEQSEVLGFRGSGPRRGCLGGRVWESLAGHTMPRMESCRHSVVSRLASQKFQKDAKGHVDWHSFLGGCFAYCFDQMRRKCFVLLCSESSTFERGTFLQPPKKVEHRSAPSRQAALFDSWWWSLFF